MRATCTTHLILLHIITRTLLGEQYRSLSSSLCSFLHSPVTSSLLSPNILLNILSSNRRLLKHSVFIFSSQQSKRNLMVKGIRSVETSANTHRMTQRHIPEQLNLQQPRCEKLKWNKCRGCRHSATGWTVQD